MQGYCDVFSTDYFDAYVGAKVEHFDVSNVIYHKFSHGAVTYILNGENVNVVLELYTKAIFQQKFSCP